MFGKFQLVLQAEQQQFARVRVERLAVKQQRSARIGQVTQQCVQSPGEVARVWGRQVGRFALPQPEQEVGRDAEVARDFGQGFGGQAVLPSGFQVGKRCAADVASASAGWCRTAACTNGCKIKAKSDKGTAYWSAGMI